MSWELGDKIKCLPREPHIGNAHICHVALQQVLVASSRFIALLTPPTIIADVKRQTVGSIQRDRRLT